MDEEFDIFSSAPTPHPKPQASYSAPHPAPTYPTGSHPPPGPSLQHVPRSPPPGELDIFSVPPPFKPYSREGRTMVVQSIRLEPQISASVQQQIQELRSKQSEGFVIDPLSSINPFAL